MTLQAVPDIGAKLREARKEKGWSQERVAYAVGLEQSDLSKIERGKRVPTPDLVRRLADTLDLDAASLLSR